MIDQERLWENQEIIYEMLTLPEESDEQGKKNRQIFCENFESLLISV